jgi:DNA modification methylase
MTRIETFGDATLYLGDCREILEWLPSVDTVVTSPPYNCGKDYGAANDQLDLDDYLAFLRDTLFGASSRVRVVNVGQFIGSRETRKLFRDILLSVSFEPLVDEVYWDKGPVNGSGWGNYPNSPRIRAQHENIFVFGETRMPYGNGLEWKDWSRLTTSIWRIPPKVDLSLHPAMMPLALAERCISLWSDMNGEVLDQFMGSGTTGVAALKLGRRFIGIEQNETYFDIACRRIEDSLRQGSLFGEAA